MEIVMWMLNLFSLFSCFGALVVLVFIGIKSKEKKYWKLLGIILIYVFSYASGILFLIINYGFTIPDIASMDIIPVTPSISYYFGSVLYLIQFWLIISATSEFLDFPVKLSYIVFTPLVFTGFIVPDILLLLNRDLLMKYDQFYIIFRLFLGYAIMEHVVIAFIVRKKLLKADNFSWISILMIFFCLLLIPAMFIEDLLTISRGILAYNIVEALGFFLLMATVMIMGISYLSSRSKKVIDTVSLLDISRTYGLTAREMDVLKELVLASSASYKDIASRLNISPETVKTHVSRIYKKLGVSAKQELKYKIRDISL